jgi:hypothetical protein
MASKTNIRPQDVNSLATKLEAFAAGLPQHEQGVVDWMLARARAANGLELSDSDLEGAGGGVADADALSSDSVKWTHTF